MRAMNKTYDNSTLAYMAGIVDGEGNIGVRSNGKYINPILQVTNTRKELLDWIEERFGGCVYANKERRPGRKLLWSWQVWGRSAQALLSLLLPFLVLKGEHAQLAISVPRFETHHVGQSVMTDGDFARNKAIQTQFGILNQRGVPCQPNQ